MRKGGFNMTIRHSELTQRVSAALQEDPRTRDAAIDVADENSIITLTGSVASDDVRQVAEEIVQQQKGVIEVINELQVESEDEEGVIAVVAPAAHEIHGTVVGT
jgi:osmotically-inducible protein OsmY